MHGVFLRMQEESDGSIKTENSAREEELLQELVEDYTTGKQQSLMQMKKGQLGREAFFHLHQRLLLSRGVILHQFLQQLLLPGTV